MIKDVDIPQPFTNLNFTPSTDVGRYRDYDFAYKNGNYITKHDDGFFIFQDPKTPDRKTTISVYGDNNTAKIMEVWNNTPSDAMTAESGLRMRVDLENGEVQYSKFQRNNDDLNETSINKAEFNGLLAASVVGKNDPQFLSTMQNYQAKVEATLPQAIAAQTPSKPIEPLPSFDQAFQSGEIVRMKLTTDNKQCALVEKYTYDAHGAEKRAASLYCDGKEVARNVKPPSPNVAGTAEIVGNSQHMDDYQVAFDKFSKLKNHFPGLKNIPSKDLQDIQTNFAMGALLSVTTVPNGSLPSPTKGKTTLTR